MLTNFDLRNSFLKIQFVLIGPAMPIHSVDFNKYVYNWLMLSECLKG